MRAFLAVLMFTLASSSLGIFPAHATATPTPKPKHTAVPKRIVLPPPPYPKVPLHTEFLVEVNKLGQIVRVESGKSSKNLTYNAQTYGNVLQMWIRRPDGTGEVGLYRVTYDYTPNNHKIRRGIALVKAGGNWGDKLGAVNQMLEAQEKREEKDDRAKRTPEPVNLPSLDTITGSRKPQASPSP